MKKLIFILLLFLSTEIAFAIPFEPPVVTITGYPVLNWHGGEATITFDLEGRDCTVYLCIYTTDKAANIPYTNTIDLGTGLPYHYVNGVDTLLYLSPGEVFTVGKGRTITWDGYDKIGNSVIPDELPLWGTTTYYLIAIDEGVSGALIPTGMGAISSSTDQSNIQYKTVSDGVLTKPRAWNGLGYLEFGSDTESPVSVSYDGPEGVYVQGAVTIDPANDAVVYFEMWDGEEEMLKAGKLTINADAPATLHTDYATDGFFSYAGGPSYETSGGNMMDGIVVCGSMDYMETFADIYTLDADTGAEINKIDFSEWFVDPTAEGQKCGGPGKLRFSVNQPNMVWNVNQGGCARLCFDPSQKEATIWWADMNGDYYCDKNYPGCYGYNPDMEWVCHDYSSGDYNYCLYNDDYDFVHIIINRGVGGKWEILGPDGSGIATAGSLGSIEGPLNHWMAVIYGGTAYDGVYTPITTTEVVYNCWQGYDIFNGDFLYGIGVEEETPIKYTLSNAPDPFNPSTNITYSIAKPGRVTLETFNILGQKVATLFEGNREAGTYSINWNASGQANGLYFAVMKAGGISKTEKMMLMK